MGRPTVGSKTPGAEPTTTTDHPQAEAPASLLTAPRHRATLLATGLVIAFGSALWLGDDSEPVPEPRDDTAPGNTAPIEFTDLTDGQEIEIVIDNPKRGGAMVTVQCTTPDPSPADDCDPTTARWAASATDDTVRANHEVWRVITTPAAGTVDCTRQACALRSYPIDTETAISVIPLDFDERRAGRLPTPITTTEDNVSHRRTITLHATALPDETITVRGCATGPGPFDCDPLFVIPVTPVDGVLELRIRPADWTSTRAEPCPAACHIEFEAPGLLRNPPTLRLPAAPPAPVSAPPRPEPEITSFEVSEHDELRDGQPVVISVPGIELGPEYGISLCIDPATLECTRLEASYQDGRMTIATPRHFMSWRSGRHDCTQTACVLLLTGPTLGLATPVTRAISFDPDAPLLDRIDVSLTPTSPLTDSQVIDIAFTPLPPTRTARPYASICATDRSAVCQVFATDGWSDGRTRLEVRSSLVTPAGRHSCIDDGPCELVLWTEGGLRFQPVPIRFEPSPDTVPAPTIVTLRPAGPLLDGQTVEVSVRGIRPGDEALLMLCVTETSACLSLGSLAIGSGDTSAVAQLSLRRIATVFESRTFAWRVVDCATNSCEIRLGGVDQSTPHLLTFDPTDRLPPPSLALRIDRVAPVGEPIELEGRGFTFRRLSGTDFTGIELCPGDVSLQDLRGCYPVGGFTSLQHRGRDAFTTTIEIPAAAPVFPGVHEREQCDVDCTLVVISGLGEPAVLPLTVDRE